MEKRKRVENFLTEFKHILNIAAFERELNYYRGSINKFYKGKKLTNQEINSIDKFIVSMIESYY